MPEPNELRDQAAPNVSARTPHATDPWPAPVAPPRAAPGPEAATPASFSEPYRGARYVTDAPARGTPTRASRRTVAGIAIIAVVAVLLARAVLASGLIKPGADADRVATANAFADAANAYGAAMQDAQQRWQTDLDYLPAQRSNLQSVETACDQFAATVKSIAFPDDTKADVATLLDALAVLHGRAAAGASASDEVTMLDIESQMVGPSGDVADAENRIANDLGLKDASSR